MRKKNPPDNRMRCCVGACNDHTVLLYLRYYPICEKHWNAHCDRKFKYKHFKGLREYLGFPSIKKPAGKEHFDDDYFANKFEIAIDVELNVPVVVDEELVDWEPAAPSKHPEPKAVKWNGKKQDPLELYVEINNTKVVLLRATGVAVKFSSEKAIMAAIEKLQSAVEGTPISGWWRRIERSFKKSKFWDIPEDCCKKAEEAGGKEIQ